MADNRNKGSLRRTSGIRRPGESKGTPASRNNSKKKDGRIQSDTIETRKKKSGGRAVVSSTSAKSGQRNTQSTGTPRKKKVEKKSSAPIVIILVLFWIAIIFFSAFLAYTYLVDKYENPVTEENIFIDKETQVEFMIKKGDTTRTIAQNLYDQGLISNRRIYRFLSKFNGYDGNYSAGTHVLCMDMTYEEIMVILTGNPEVVTVMFPEGFTTSQIAARLEANNICKSSAFYKAIETIDVSSYTFIKEDTFSENRDNRLDGYLFPDTYQFEANSDPEQVIYKMLNRFMEVFKPDYYVRAEELGFSIDEVVTLASIVEREAKLTDERAKIAGVFINRLNSDDPDMAKLQSCATIQYIYRKLYNVTLTEVTKEEEQVSDWYNTYICEGLPPGPICSPGIASIIAVLDPEVHDYYYFVTTGDGTGSHYFSRTFEEHKEHGG